MRPLPSAAAAIEYLTLDPLPPATACIAGATAGLLGLTNLAGFAFFLASSVTVGALYALANCGAQPSRYFLKSSEPLVAGTLGNCFSFILFWTRALLSPPSPCRTFD